MAQNAHRGARGQTVVDALEVGSHQWANCGTSREEEVHHQDLATDIFLCHRVPKVVDQCEVEDAMVLGGQRRWVDQGRVQLPGLVNGQIPGLMKEHEIGDEH